MRRRQGDGMTIEHRCLVRIPTRKWVEIRAYDCLSTFRGYTRDVSLEGMSVVTNGGELPAKTFVRVTFLSRKAGQNGFEMSAFVIHATSRGAGLLFTGPYPDVFYGLLQTPAICAVSI